MKKISLRLGVGICYLAISLTSLFSKASVEDFLPAPTLKQIAEEISGESAKRNLDQITQYHRMRASDGFGKAADVVLARLRAAGYKDATELRFVADGKTMFGTQKSRLAWQVSFAELWEVDSSASHIPIYKMADWAARPLTVAQDSDSADVVTTLVDIGAGTSEADYNHKSVKGKIVLTSSQPKAVAELAIKKYGAVGILSYAANQKSAWWKLDDTLVRWGHLHSFRDYSAFGFMTSLGEARKLKARLESGEKITLHANIKAVREKGEYRLVTAVLEGSDPVLKNEEIVLSCHLDHPRPGANDNASGCVTILEIARSLKRLVKEGRVIAPLRSIRFIWPSEVETSLIFLNAKPKMAKRIKHVIHLDMVGGGPITKSVFYASRGPYSVADVSGDLIFDLLDFVNRHTLDYTSGVDTPFPLTAPEGGREPLLGQTQWLDMGSDHDVFAEGSWSIPITYLHDSPDRYIHTHKDLPDNIDPTKLKRAAFLGLAQALILASLDEKHLPALVAMQREHQFQRVADLSTQMAGLNEQDRAAALRGHKAMEQQMALSVKRYVPKANVQQTATFATQLSNMVAISSPLVEGPVWKRNVKIKGTMNAFGYSYIEEHLGANKVANLALLSLNRGREIAYEALNLINGKRTQSGIHDLLIAQLGQVPKPALDEYFNALAEIKIIKR